MKRLEHLPEITDHILSGLRADDALKHRIFLSAASSPESKKYPRRTIFALCGISALLILLCVFVIRSETAGDIQVVSAGSRHSTPPVILENVLEEAAELSE